MSTARPTQRFRSNPLTRFQARFGRRVLIMIGVGLFRLKFEIQGMERVPASEPLIVAAAPHRGWIDSFMILMALPSHPRVYFLGSAEGMFNRWWKRAILAAMGGAVSVSTRGESNREGLETSLAILTSGNRLGIFPEGWDATAESPTEVLPLKRGVAFLSEHAGCRVLPIGLAGTQELWRGKTIRLRFGAPLAALPPNAARPAEQAYVAQLRESLIAALPSLPPEPIDGKKPWPWLTRLL